MTICFIGHRIIKDKIAIALKLNDVLLKLIERGADCFLFGSNSEFDFLCWESVTNLKTQLPSLKRIYVRSSFPNNHTDYINYLLNYYEDTYLLKKLEKAGKSAYVERNFEMINKADVCVFYYDKNYTIPLKPNQSSINKSHKRNSGTKIAYKYALSKKKEIINICDG